MAGTAYDDRDGYIWMDGEFVPWRDTKVHVLTHALHYASSVFEGERAYNGKIFRSLDHSRRLHNSARIMGFDIPYTGIEFCWADTPIISDPRQAIART